MKICGRFVIVFHFVLVIITLSSASNICPMSSCGAIRYIRSPFYIENSNSAYICGRYKLYCELNRTVIYFDPYNEKQIYFKYVVQSINYSNYTFRLVAPNVRENICSSIPIYSLATDQLMDYEVNQRIYSNASKSSFRYRNLTQSVIFVSCKEPVNSSIYIDTSPCINGSATRHYSYVIVGREITFSDLEDSCRVDSMTLISSRKKKFSSFREVQNEFAYGFELSFLDRDCFFIENYNEVNCYSYDPYIPPSRMEVVLKYISGVAEIFEKKVLVYIEIPRMVCVLIVIAILVHKWYTRHSSMHDGIEEFLQRNNNLMPIRYSYWEIRIMTRVFKDKLGEGGFGSVYKGTLSNGRLVAVKMLGKSKANGQDFINEVATIGRIHHANVVHLIGFCATGSKRALVYDFMPNGSLEKYIFRKEGVITTHSLSYKEIFNVSLGVARGINYLHQGCDMQILHFDIKPHNILLDENFAPKVSDFGLARLCPLDNSVVSLTAARGTIGYIAPELFYKNIGGVSHKSDVYSFGMLLMEMANKRKNVNARASKSSQIYFPTWIFDQFSKGNDMELEEEATEEESEIVKKMIIVALWCIQLKPSDRPSMSKVMEMLEGDLESLEMPPKPYLFPQVQDCDQDPNHGFEEATESSWSSTPMEEDSTEISLISNT